MNGLITFISIAALFSSAWASIPNQQASTITAPTTQVDPNNSGSSLPSLPPNAFIYNMTCDKAFVPLPASLNMTHLPFDAAMCQNFASNDTTLCYLNTCKETMFASCSGCHRVLPSSTQDRIDLAPGTEATVECQASWIIHDQNEPNLKDHRPMCINATADTFLCDGACSGSTTCGQCFNSTAFKPEPHPHA